MNRALSGWLVLGIVLLVLGVPTRAQDCLHWLQAESVPNGFSLNEVQGAYDTQRNVMVFFGGELDANTREFDGTDWTEIASKGPGARRHHAMTFDSLRGVVVMFGGVAEGTGQYLGGTWEWNGTTWTLVAADGPSPRYGHAMAFDESHGRTVLFGGTDEHDDLSDTWVWDGVAWEHLDVSGPSRRTHPAMTYDDSRGVVVLFGGREGKDNSNQTWEFDGVEWSHRATGGPQRRYGHQMAYDRDQQVTVMFDGVGAQDGTWMWDGVSWLRHQDGGRPRPSTFGNGYSLWYDRPAHVIRLYWAGFERTWTIGIGHLFVNGSAPTDQAVTEGVPTVLRFDLELYDATVCEFTGPASIQWRHEGVPIVDDGRVFGSQTNALAIFPAQLSDAGEYDVVITRPCGELTTLPVQLTVVPSATEPCALRPDVNESGWVDFNDLVEVLANWGQGCP